MRASILLIATALVLGVAAPAALGELEEIPANLEDHRSRIVGLDQAAIELREARERVIELEEKRIKQRQLRYPRGEAKAELEESWRQAVADESRLERRWVELLEKARREGVPPGVLRRYRDMNSGG